MYTPKVLSYAPSAYSSLLSTSQQAVTPKSDFKHQSGSFSQGGSEFVSFSGGGNFFSVNKLKKAVQHITKFFSAKFSQTTVLVPELAPLQSINSSNFDKLKGKLISPNIKVLKAGNGNIVRMFVRDKDTSKLEKVVDFDAVTSIRTGEAFYSPFEDMISSESRFSAKDGKLLTKIMYLDNLPNSVWEYEPENGILKKLTSYYPRTDIVSYIAEYNPKTAKLLREMLFDKNSKISSLVEYDKKSGEKIIQTEYDTVAGKKKFTDEYSPKTKNKKERTFFDESGTVVSSVLKFDPITELPLERTYFKSDGKTVDFVEIF